jgi:acetyltransferase-like isoleucine patch superfamily enzyme
MPLRLRAWVNQLRRWLWRWFFFRPVFGERSAHGTLLAETRISPSTCIENPDGLQLGDRVFIGHFNFIEASHGVRIDEGVQITNFVSILSHSSHRSIRLAGPDYVVGSAELPAGFVTGPVHIGAYSFVGPHTSIEANTILGKGCLVRSHSCVRGEYPDFSIIAGVPARRVGDTRDGDRHYLERQPDLRASYEAWAGKDAVSLPDEGS